MILSKYIMSAGRMVRVLITPSATPFAITIPISAPNVNDIVHIAKKPAIVVKDEDRMDVLVRQMADTIASSLDLFTFSS